MSRYWSKSLCSKGGWVTFSTNFRGKGASPPTIIGIRKLEYLGYRMVQKMPKIQQAEYGAPTLQTTDGRAIAYSQLEFVHVR